VYISVESAKVLLLIFGLMSVGWLYAFVVLFVASVNDYYGVWKQFQWCSFIAFVGLVVSLWSLYTLGVGR
jgi:hypothetical protein